MTFGFLSGSRNFCKFFWVSCEVLFLHGYAWIHRVTRSCTTTANRWLLRDSQLSLRTLWSAVIKSPKFTARGTVPPLRLLHGALVILVRLQISQFRSLGKWVWTLCLPNSSRLFAIGSKEASWEEVAWEPPCNGISSSTKISVNSCSHWGISESPHGFLSFGFPQVSMIYHQQTQTLALERCHCQSHLPFLDPEFRLLWEKKVRMKKMKKNDSPVSQVSLIRCRWRTWQAWNHDRNEVLRVANIRIPFLMRCGFWPLIHS